MKRIIAVISIASLLGLAVPLAGAEKPKTDWVKTRFGRVSPHPGYWTTDPERVGNFQPSGIGCQIYRIGEYTVLHNRGLYWSCEQNRDTSHDMHASVVVFRGKGRVFAARGYEFLTFHVDAGESAFSFQHWSGTMGDDQITCFDFSVTDGKLEVSTRKKSTKDESP
jgi:hypothetical protein